jgi:hypothetical protein
MSSANDQGYSSFYQHLAVSPEIGSFRRFGAYWAKKVHDDTSEFLACLAVLNQELEKWPELGAQTVLDCPKTFMKEKYPVGTPDSEPLHDAWDKFDAALTRYGTFGCAFA